ncbi:sigma-70 family RNA polymerase sigma factor [Nakamurella sp. YIM 132087]|uniref:Sigma-70 family RNA polymerase sigma factor n=1 Tax=Nakamurella alba TaxID=2665158 RepID=A0A7K1FU87_9ACTN|nr:sigma-70 family RNA polymerase sigma factor [Nakamurella alba]MTD16753.1 sigma-70 family RNA polymerase sigma factor [Nakamurella alba]
MTDPARDLLAHTVRREGARVLATLIRTVGDVQVAEDAVQEAVVAALTSWPRTGVPAEPRAWLTLTARRKALDVLRRESGRSAREEEGLRMIELGRSDLPPEDVVRDDQLRLIFTCCHPTLAPATRVALALRTLCGLDVPTIATVLLGTEAATAKRLTRARQKIAAARIPYRVPDVADLPDRLPAVCAVIQALYTAGYRPSSEDPVVRTEAVRLAELLHDLLPAQTMPQGLLALLLLTEARRPARLDDRGEPVPLDRQDRNRWDRPMIDRGIDLLNRSLLATQGSADPYQLQAAIAAEHDRAVSADATDHAEILRLYDLLVAVAPSEPARLARAVAVAEVHGSAAGLAALDELPPGGRRDEVRADLLERNRG